MSDIWIRGEFLLQAQVPLCPPRRIINFNIKKMIAYAKSKGTDGYPNMTLECWRYLAVNKLQISQELADTYFEIALDSCLSIPNLIAAFVQDLDQTKGKKKIPLLCFAVFLFLQQANRLNLRASMSGLEKRPRAISEHNTSVTRGRRSSLTGSFGQENIESRVMEFVLTDLQALLELLVVYDDNVQDYHAPRTRRDVVLLRSLTALDLILEGYRKSEPGTIVPFTTLVKSDMDISRRSVDSRALEDYIRRNLKPDPFNVVAPFCELPLQANIDGLISAMAKMTLNRANSEDTMNTASGDQRKPKISDFTDLDNGNAAKIRTNFKSAPASHKMVITNFIGRQTIGKGADMIEKSILHIGKCYQSHIYLLSPFKTALIRRCRFTTIVLGPTASVVRLQNCHDCTLVVMCRRLFITDCQRCTIYAKTAFRPLICGSTNSQLTFAPFCTWYGDLEKHMASVGITNRPDRWNEPVVFANGDPKPAAIDSSTKPCWTIMDPKDFYPMNIPFKTSGATKTIPAGIPPMYKVALEERQKTFNDWNKYVAGLQEGERTEVKKLVEKEYAAWLEKTGHLEEVSQLHKLEVQQKKKQPK